MIKKSITFCCLVIFALPIFSQAVIVRSFDEHLENYPETVASMFPANVSEEDRALITKFSEAWNDGTFTNSEKIEIIRISNGFIEKRARNVNYWTFWRCLLSFKEPENTGKGLNQWMQAIIASFPDRTTTPTSLLTLMNNTLELINKRLIFSSSGHIWKLSNDNYRYEFVDDKMSVAVIGSFDLTCIVRTDSITIFQTTGRFWVEEQEWTGRGGTVSWERAGFSTNQVAARLANYTINVRRPEFEADSAMFTHHLYFPNPVMGQLIDRVRRVSNPSEATYPEFITYGKRYLFSNLYPDVDFIGGMRIQGARVVGAGGEDENAMIVIRKGNDSLKVNVSSSSFVFTDDRVSSRNVMLAIHFFGDSIYHTNLGFSYIVSTREVNFFRTEVATSQAPYFNTYHRISMSFDQIVWRTNEPIMTFSMARGATMGRAQFRSENFFDRRTFDGMQFMDAQHPLVLVRQVARNTGSATFTSAAYATHIRRALPDARVQLINIARQGFILFDSERDLATMQPNLQITLDAASRLRDFDVIDMNSTVNAPVQNATFDVRTHDLVINGIQSFMVSDSQNVVIRPRGQRVLMQKNRTFEIDGQINAGRVEMYGDLMKFDYDGFRIDLTKVDSMYLYIPTGGLGLFGQQEVRRLTSAITGLSGRLLIDQPNNKSGRQSLKQYPILYNDSLARVRYSSSNIEGGAYATEDFYFELDPFVLDSIDNLRRRSVAFHGTFHSAGIFDNMRQVLVVQPDYSLGFVHSADTALSTYKQSTLHAEVRLSNQGLMASGQLDYLTTTIHAEDFKLYPDSMNVLESKQFVMRKQTGAVEFPDVTASRSRIHWTPKQERMYIMDREFSMYNPETKLDGALLLTPRGLGGNGLVDIMDGTAQINSEDFDFKSNKFSAEQSNLKMQPVKDGPYRVMTIDSLRSEIDFDQRRGRFVPNGSKQYTLVDFPSTKYAAYVEEMVWEIDNGLLHINSLDTVGAPVDFKYAYPGENRGSRFYATTRGADSLSFVAPRATLNLEKGDMKAEGVNLVKTSDAIVYPGEGKLTVNTEGEIEVADARVVFNDEIKQFTVYEAELKMQGRRQYSGFGKYDYIDETGTPWKIDISQIASDRNTGKTTATGMIQPENNFRLSPFFRYEGRITLLSDSLHPVFTGTSQIVHECEVIKPDFYRFTSMVNPDSLYLPVSDEPVNNSGNRIFNGFFMSVDSVYPAVFSMPRPGQRQLINTHGYLTYDKDSISYFIAPKAKLFNRDTIGNLFKLNRDRCLLSAEGQFMSLGGDFGSVKTDAVGSIKYNLNNHEVLLDIMLSFDFFFDPQLAAMAARMIENDESLTGVDMQRTTFIRGMNEWLGVSASNTYRTAALLGEVERFPAELSGKTLVLTHLQMYWDYEDRCFRSYGKIGVGNIFGHQLNRMIDGMVEIYRQANNDRFNVYLRIDNENWVLFSYTRENMQVGSSNREITEQLAKIPERRRRIAERRPGYRFTYMLATTERVAQVQSIYQRRARQTAPSTSPGSGGNQSPQQPVVTPPIEDTPIIEIE